MKRLFFVIPGILIISALFSSCKKDEPTQTGEITIKFLEPYADTEVLPDTVYVASDLTINYRALVSPIEDVEFIHFRIFFDYTQALEYHYTPSHTTGGTAYLIDSIRYPIDYKAVAGSIHFVTLQVEAVTFNGAKKESHLTYEIQPVNYPFQFRFFDFNSSDTLQVGQTVTMRPYFSPLTVNQTIASMKVFEKIGFGAEAVSATFGPSDFFYYQVGWLREMEYQVPDLPSGSTIVHRFELQDSFGSRHVIQHQILVQ
ncbi:MAG: hypothetical protein JNL22_13240 [Bacteroidales bacterium]|jgi:hypothetical protein|nr:hypothetical protein [Bacteroidales bacterium]